MQSLPITILLAEDDDGHAFLVQRILERNGVMNKIVRVRDGLEALDFVYARGPFAHRSRSMALLILLDLNMPQMDGFETLAHLKGDPQMKHIPIIMLTTTDNPHEIARCYALGCGIYVTKPVSYEQFADAIRQLHVFLQFIQIPTVAS